MAVLVDQRLEVDESLSSALNSLLSLHISHPLLAVAAFEQDRGGIVNVYFDDGTRIAADITPKGGTQVTTITWHPTRKLLCIGWENGDLSVWNETDHATKDTQTKHKRAVSATSWSPNGSQLVSADVIGSCMGWKLDSQGALSILFHHELSTSISGIVFRVPYEPTKQDELTRLAKAAVDGDENALNVFTMLNSGDNRQSKSSNLRESLSFFLGSLSGMVFYVNEGGTCTDILQMEGAIKSILHYSAKDILILVTEMLVLAQFKVSDDGTVTELSKIKLSGQNPNVTVDWAGQETLAVCTGEKVLRLWNVESGQNCVLSLEGQSFENSEVISCVAYDKVKCILAAGTSHGHVVTWRCVGVTDSFTKHNLQEEDWKIQPSVKVQGTVRSVGFGTNKQLLGVVTATDAYIFSEQDMCCSFSEQKAAIQLSARHVSVEILDLNFAIDLRTDVHIRNVFISQSHVAISNGKRLLFYEINKDTKSVKFIGSFNTESQKVVLHRNEAFVLEGNNVEIKTCQGNLKQTFAFNDEEGKPVSMSLCGSFLTISTLNGYVRVWDVSQRDAKLQAGPKLFDSILQNTGGIIASAKSNSAGNKISFVIGKNTSKGIEVSDPLIYIWDTENGSVCCFNLHEGTYGDVKDKEPSPLTQCQGSEISELLRGRHPLSHFWDPDDPRLLVATLKLSFTTSQNEPKKDRRVRIKRSTSSQTFRWEQKASVTTVSMFVTSEKGLLIQDVFPLQEDQVDLVGVQVPFYYVQSKNANESLNTQDTKPINPKSLGSASEPTGFVKGITMRDFNGLEKCDKATRDAVMDFSFYLTSNNMDEAFRAIKMIKNQSVWDNMAKMCVKTKRLDVASVCLGKMENARAAKALRESASVPELEARVAILAVHLGMISEAERLLKACSRYDLLNRLYQDSGQWNKALEVAEVHDRIHRRSTYYKYANHLESKGDITSAIPMYEKSETHHFEVPRMLFDEPRVLEAYILKTKDKELFRWWAQYMESADEMETARQYYEAAQDYLSLVRVYCYCSNLDKAAEIANETGDRAACFHLARQYENQDNIKEAVHFFTRAQAYNNAIRIAKEHGLDDQLFNLALMSGNNEIFEVAKYYEERPEHQDKAIMLYHKAGFISKAIDLAFKNREYGALHHIVTDLNKDTDPKLLAKCARFFTDNGQFEKAVNLLATADQHMEALSLCYEKNIPLTEDLAEKMTMSKNEGDQQLRTRILEKIGEIAMLQENYHLAAKKYTQSGNKVQAMKALLKSGDTEKIIFFAGVSRNRDIFIMAANYLQSLDWKENPDIMKQIISFYTKGKAMDSLAGFYEACARVEIDEYQNYEKALGALNEAHKCSSKSTGDPAKAEIRQRDLRQKMEFVKRFVQARSVFDTSPEEALNQCRTLLADSDVEIAIRRGDIYGFLVEKYAEKQNFKAAYSLIEEMQNRLRGATLTYYVAPDILKSVYQALNIQPVSNSNGNKDDSDGEEIPEDYTNGY